MLSRTAISTKQIAQIQSCTSSSSCPRSSRDRFSWSLILFTSQGSRKKNSPMSSRKRGCMAMTCRLSSRVHVNRRRLDRKKHGCGISYRSISNSSTVFVVVHDQLNKQCHWEENTHGLSVSFDCSDGSSGVYSAVFVANTPCLERSRNEIITEIQSTKTDFTSFIWKGFCGDNSTC